MAVVSFWFVLILSLSAVMAPFLAGNVPIVMKGAYRVDEGVRAGSGGDFD